jgi:sugar lactone lactonase YvrE
VTDYSTILTGIGMGESARWHDGRLWFADWMAGTISVCEPGTVPRVVTSVPSFPISFDWLPDGRMLVVSGGEGTLLVLNGGVLELYADLSGLSPYPWNELAISAGGDVYVNGIGYEFPGPAQVAGLIAVVKPNGVATVVARDLAFPNGMVIDGATLVVGESHAGCLTAFEVDPDGSLGGRRVWAAVPDSAPDGICWGAQNAIWYADVPGQHCVLVAEGGRVLSTADFTAACFSCAASDDTLFAMTADWPLSFDPTAPRSGEVRALALHNA